MDYIRIDNQDYPIIEYKETYDIDNDADSLQITLSSLSYDEILILFRDGMAWQLVKSLTNNKLFSNFKQPVNDLSEYRKLINIVDNLNGTFTIKMNKMSRTEKAIEEAVKAQIAEMLADMSMNTSEESFISEIEADEAYTKGVNES